MYRLLKMIYRDISKGESEEALKKYGCCWWRPGCVSSPWCFTVYQVYWIILTQITFLFSKINIQCKKNYTDYTITLNYKQAFIFFNYLCSNFLLEGLDCQVLWSVHWTFPVKQDPVWLLLWIEFGKRAALTVLLMSIWPVWQSEHKFRLPNTFAWHYFFNYFISSYFLHELTKVW